MIFTLSKHLVDDIQNTSVKWYIITSHKCNQAQSFPHSYFR